MLEFQLVLESSALAVERLHLAQLGRQRKRSGKRHLVAEVRQLDVGSEVKSLDRLRITQVERERAAEDVVALQRGIGEGSNLRDKGVGADETSQRVAELHAILVV